MLQVDMSAVKRDNFGKCAMRRLRVSGNTPAVLYGNNKDVTPLQLETTAFTKCLFQVSRKNAVVNLSLNGDETRHVMVKEIQTDPVDDSLIHADFYEIDLNVAKSFTVPVKFTGKAKGEDLGGELLVQNGSVVLEGLPLDIPDSVTLDVSDLGIGDSIQISAIELPEKVKMKTDDSFLCVEVVVAHASEGDDDSGSSVSEVVSNPEA